MGIKGIDMAAGLESVNNDEEIFMEILQIYYEDGVSMLETLRQNLQHTDMKTFIIHTHAMKSASKGIGANEVSERFREMEFAGKDNAMDVIEERLGGCLALFEELLGNIKRYLDGEDAQTDSGDAADTKVADFLKDMKRSLEDMDTDMFEELLGKLEAYSASIGGYEPLGRIKDAYEDFDFAKTIAIMEEVIDN